MRFDELKKGDCFTFEGGKCIKTARMTTIDHTFNALVLVSTGRDWYRRGDYLVMVEDRIVEKVEECDE